MATSALTGSGAAGKIGAPMTNIDDIKPPDRRPSRTGFERGPRPDPQKWPLPDDYLDMAANLGGGEGFVGPEYVRFYHPEEVLSVNAAYAVQQYAPGFLLIGSNGGGEAYAYDFRSKPPVLVCMPFIPMTPAHAIRVADSVRSFLLDLLATGKRHEAAWSQCIDPEGVGLEVHDIKPIAFGGKATDLSNKILLRPAEHAQYCRFWNDKYVEMKKAEAFLGRQRSGG